jgi:hypothetical protein
VIGYFSMYRTSNPLNVCESISTFLKPGEFRSNGIFFTSSRFGRVRHYQYFNSRLLLSYVNMVRSESATSQRRNPHLL